ncbi:acyltransferase family protein [Arthrobacter crystallopoietes]|uniref:Peptidoglycan/LPS O-acetylase OafA/YrhL, contains acyltransferase and SGNH-hydrolase domains n=1 Tax=Crystallibacter crystallopoietes TaxID=37928 RepID=A0A1H1EZX9_9MICC|nr:acyltransferase family protein [Arthrobacter crystallopoietes]SDQ94210.1 Peptidoglycan/LPS O-acetylase OafA/YrhL, contains acyltransferase and SGNH-hydrolase domains [Arthrobacter crystallopoietes]
MPELTRQAAEAGGELPAAKPQRRKFLPEVQALRALAVLLVVIYHLQPGWLPGGFVGVDVFFVISGFLITGHMLREVKRTGRLSLSAFWAARARRILPAALVTIAAVCLATFLLSPATQWGRIGSQALASTFYTQNWVLAADSTDYMAAGNSATPLQHFWSLAVEEQFYLFWPLLMLLAVALGRRWRGKHGRQLPAVVPVFAVVAAASLVFSIWFTATGNPAAYFITPTRIWELALGGLLAATLTYTDRWLRIRKVLALAGAAAILTAALAFSGATPFPGAAALLPVLGTMAVIAAGRTTGAASLHAVIDRKPVQWLGNVSYSLYLWHWPLVVYYRTLADRPPSPWESLLLLAASLGPAAASYYFIETPVRKAGWLSAHPWRPIGAGIVAMGLIGTLALAPGQQREQLVAERAVQTQQLLEAPPSQFGAKAMDASADKSFAGANEAIVPDPNKAVEDEFDFGDCVAQQRDAETPECEYDYRKNDGGPTVALVGDSHAGQWAPALDVLAKERGWNLVTYIHNSCPFTPERRVLEAEGKSVCTEPNAQTLERLVDRGDVDAVITSYFSSSVFEDTDTGHRPGVAGMAEYWNTLADAGIDVYPIVDTPAPRPGADPRDCVDLHYGEPERCSQPRSEGFDGQDITRESAALAPRARVVDLSDKFCGADSCPMVIGNVMLYRDFNHVTRTYMLTLVDRLGEELEAAKAE